MVLKIHYGGDSEILNYEYEREIGNNSEYEFTSDGVDDEDQEENSIEDMVLMLNESEKKPTVNDEDQLIDKSYPI